MITTVVMKHGTNLTRMYIKLRDMTQQTKSGILVKTASEYNSNEIWDEMSAIKHLMRQELTHVYKIASELPHNIQLPFSQRLYVHI